MNQAVARRGDPDPVRLSRDVIDFLESGLSVILGVVGPDGRARAGRALAVRVLADGRLRLIYPEEGNAAIIAAAAAAGPLAVTFSAPVSHRTIQIKGSSCQPEEMDEQDRLATDRQASTFAATLEAIGYPPYFVNAFCRYSSAKLCVLSVLPQIAFEQTPGPGAGGSL
ncbi:MAG: hypothetical protein U1E58_07875 [Tabrizicola sp.]